MENAPSSGLTCVSCGEDAVIEIAMTLPDATEVVFKSCHVCETRWWDKEGEPVNVDRIIDIVGN